MPAISLVVCVYCEGELLARLLAHAANCYDDLVVVHDGPDATGMKAMVEAAGGRFYEQPRACQQEPHWPFAWGQARHDWILRLDADEFPGDELKTWLQEFRHTPAQPEDVSGYTCIWPLWNGQRAVTCRWPAGRIFFFHKQRVRFWGMAETTPVPDSRFEPLGLVLHHEPLRISYGLRNILLREQAYRWRKLIAQSLLATPLQLACWRWTAADWPAPWSVIRRYPLRHAFKSLIWFSICQCKDMLRAGEWPRPAACLNPGLNHFLLGLAIWREQRRSPKP